MSNPIENFASAWFNLVKSHFKLFKLEAKLAKMSLLPLIISGVAVLLLGFSLWLVVLVMIACLIFEGTHRLWLGVLIDLLLSGVLTAIAVYLVLKYASRIQFKETMKNLLHFRAKKAHDQSKHVIKRD